MTEQAAPFIVVAIILLGLAKGGFGGVGAPIALPIMALGVPLDLALGALLPILIITDVVSVGSHRKHADVPAVLYALPGSVLGVLLGAALIAYLSANLTGMLVGSLAIAFALMGLTGYMPRISGWPNWTSGVFGALSGVTSTLAHAGGPPIHIFFLSRGYPPAQFIATSALFMAGVNLIKIVPFIAVGALNAEALQLAVYAAPLAILAAFFGVWLARRVSKTGFKYAVNGLMFAVGCKLIFDAVT